MPLRIMNLLKKNGAEVSYYDPYLSTVSKNNDFGEWTGTTSVEWNNGSISSIDATIISTDHSIINTVNAMWGIKPKNENYIIKA